MCLQFGAAYVQCSLNVCSGMPVPKDEIFSRDLSQDNKKCYPRTVITLLQSCLLAPLPTWGQFHSQHLGPSLQ